MESEKVKAAPVIPGNLSYVITKKVIVKKRRYDNVYIDTAFLDFQWLLKSRSRDITRTSPSILVETTKMIATDGLRLHIIANPYPSIPPGKYEVYGINQSKIILIAKDTNPAIKFPNWNIPRITMEGIKPEDEITITNPTFFYIEILKRRIVNIHFLEDAFSPEPMNVRIYSGRRPVIITTLTRTAIIMPLITGEGYPHS